MDPRAETVYEIGIDVPESLVEQASALMYVMFGSYPAELYPQIDDGLPMPDDVPEIQFPPEGMVRLTVYTDSEPFLDVLPRLKSAMQELFVRSGVQMEASPLVRELKGEQWQTAWQKFFSPVQVGKGFVVAPPWEIDAARAMNPKHLIVVKPGMAFGTGQHESTQLVMRLMEGLFEEHKFEKVFDIGCGSGILSIAAAMLGAADITGIDIDEDAIREAVENAVANGFEQITFKVGTAVDIVNSRKKAPLVLANILLPVLMEDAENLSSIVEEGGFLILAGITVEQEHDIMGRYTPLGLEMYDKAVDGEWLSIVFKKK